MLAFLGFHPNYAELAKRLARAITDHSTPVGSCTVARTKRIPAERRAEAAVIADFHGAKLPNTAAALEPLFWLILGALC